LDNRAVALSFSIVCLQRVAVGVEVVYALRHAENIQNLVRTNIAS